MRFSIIIPVYNVEEYLGQCLDSIAHQDYSDYEVVIVDDGSTDGSASIYERFAAEADVPVRIVKQENKGLLLARRAGIKAANGDYYWHVDGDDGLAPNAMCAVSGIIDELDPDVVLICLSESPTFGSVLPGGLPGEQRFYTGESLNDVRSAFLDGYIPNMVTKIARRSCVDADSDYSPYGKMQLGEDQLQSLYILDNMKSAACVREPLYYYRPNASSITANYREARLPSTPWSRKPSIDRPSRGIRNGRGMDLLRPLLSVICLTVSTTCARMLMASGLKSSSRSSGIHRCTRRPSVDAGI